jgi:hypothetical protein
VAAGQAIKAGRHRTTADERAAQDRSPREMTTKSRAGNGLGVLSTLSCHSASRRQGRHRSVSRQWRPAGELALTAIKQPFDAAACAGPSGNYRKYRCPGCSQMGCATPTTASVPRELTVPTHSGCRQ